MYIKASDMTITTIKSYNYTDSEIGKMVLGGQFAYALEGSLNLVWIIKTTPTLASTENPNFEFKDFSSPEPTFTDTTVFTSTKAEIEDFWDWVSPGSISTSLSEQSTYETIYSEPFWISDTAVSKIPPTIRIKYVLD